MYHVTIPYRYLFWPNVSVKALVNSDTSASKLWSLYRAAPEHTMTVPEIAVCGCCLLLYQTLEVRYLNFISSAVCGISIIEQ